MTDYDLDTLRGQFAQVIEMAAAGFDSTAGNTHVLRALIEALEARGLVSAAEVGERAQALAAAGPAPRPAVTRAVAQIVAAPDEQPRIMQ